MAFVTEGSGPIEKFTHVSGTYGDDDGDENNDFMLYDHDDDDETQTP